MQLFPYQCMNDFMHPYSDVILIWVCWKLIWTEVYRSCNRPEERIFCSYDCMVIMLKHNSNLRYSGCECIFLSFTACCSYYVFIYIWLVFLFICLFVCLFLLHSFNCTLMNDQLIIPSYSLYLKELLLKTCSYINTHYVMLIVCLFVCLFLLHGFNCTLNNDQLLPTTPCIWKNY